MPFNTKTGHAPLSITKYTNAAPLSARMVAKLLQIATMCLHVYRH